MSDSFSESNAAQPPKRLTSQIEIISNLRALMQHHDLLVMTFADRQQVFHSYIVDIDRDNNRLAYDELIPNDGERYLVSGEKVTITAYRDGVRMMWSHIQQGLAASIDGAPCYWLNLPTEVSYHQRRNAFRANTLPEQVIEVKINGKSLQEPIPARLIDISATGCKLDIKLLTPNLQLGQLYNAFDIALPSGNITLNAELRHLSKDEASNSTQAGFTFHQMSGAIQRVIERFVYQLQREARRNDDELF
ncbi:MAG: flagellar brake protein [Pseudomonas sp.]|nr:flagellar brake protein [Pseudomonas sp.]